jgi:hypothetical protein
MDELEHRLRAANPWPTRAAGDLSERAERELANLIDQEHLAPTTPRPAAGRSTMRGRWRWPVAATVVAAALSVLAVFNIANVPVATAAPPLLEFTPLDAPDDEVLAELSDRARADAATTSTLIRYESWSATIIPGADTTEMFVQPEEVTSIRDADGAGTLTIRAGEPRWGPPPPGQTVKTPGEVTRRSVYRAGEFPQLFPDAPPAAPSADELNAYLHAHLEFPTPTTAGDYFGVIRDLRSEWRLSGPQNAAVIELLGSLPDVEVAGMVHDRLGREGIALVTATRYDGGFRDVLVLDPSTGALLTSEVEYLGGVDEVTLPYPTVLIYVAWKNVEPE